MLLKADYNAKVDPIFYRNFNQKSKIISIYLEVTHKRIDKQTSNYKTKLNHFKNINLNTIKKILMM
jgi:hypothetical protein